MIKTLEILDGYPLDITSIYGKEAVFPRKIEFKPGLNVIFGPNGCGKTSIMKAIGAAGLTKGGWSNLNFDTNVFPVGGLFDFAKHSAKDFKIADVIRKIAGFGVTAKLDGPVYYHSDFDTSSYLGYHTRGTGLGGGTLSPEAATIMRMDNSIKSSGEKQMYKDGSVLSALAEGSIKFDQDSVEGEASLARKQFADCHNEILAMSCLYDYAKKTILKGGTPTILLDEPENHLSLEYTVGLFENLLPAIVNRGYQVIVATHFILTPFVAKGANFICIDRNLDRYSEYVRGLVTGMKKTTVDKVNETVRKNKGRRKQHD